jgi:hypothetical protein
MKKYMFVFIVLNLMSVIVHASGTIDTLTLTAVSPRLITPNGDGANDKVRFELDNPEGLPVRQRSRLMYQSCLMHERSPTSNLKR